MLTGACDSEEPIVEEIPPPPPNAPQQLGCAQTCHGDTYSIAPPRNLSGQIDTTLQTVGAHRSHLLPDSPFYLNVACSDCHVVPATPGDEGHIDGDGVAELTFGDRATNNGQLTPTFDGQNCSNVYCHGSTLTGGLESSPTWTQVSGQQLNCGSCHGMPPPPPHATGASCGDCHTTLLPGEGPDYIFQAPESHIDGKVDTQPDGEQTCTDCHGTGAQPAPPRDLAGNTNPDAPGVGAHLAHVEASPWHQQLACTQCHNYPVGVNDPGHLDGDGVAELNFTGLAAGTNYDAGNYECSNVYCHGDGMGGVGTMTWTDDLQLGCNDCHTTDNPDNMSGRHDKHTIQRGLECVACHDSVVDDQRNFVGPQYHINGNHDISFQDPGVWDGNLKSCDVGCHNVTRNWYQGNGNNDDDDDD